MMRQIIKKHNIEYDIEYLLPHQLNEGQHLFSIPLNISYD